MDITFLGAVGTVTGSKYLLSIREKFHWNCSVPHYKQVEQL